MTRKFLIIIILIIALIQHVAIVQVSDTGVGTIYLIGLQVIFTCITVYLRTGENVYANTKLKYIAFCSYIVLYVLLYYILMYPFFRNESFDMFLLTISIVGLANYELLFFKSYEQYNIVWMKRLIIVIPLAILLILIIRPIIGNLLYNKPMFFYEYVQYQGEYVIARRDISGNYFNAISNIIFYTIYKVDALLVIKPKKPQTTDFWLKFKPDKNYME